MKAPEVTDFDIGGAERSEREKGAGESQGSGAKNVSTRNLFHRLFLYIRIAASNATRTRQKVPRLPEWRFR